MSKVKSRIFVSVFPAVHSETKCHIHFPDSNRLYSGAEKSSQVSVTGEVTAVEAARKQIRVRQYCKLTFVISHVHTLVMGYRPFVMFMRVCILWSCVYTASNCYL